MKMCIHLGTAVLVSMLWMASTAADTKIFCFYNNKAKTRDPPYRMLPQDVRADMCTHIVYTFANVDPDTAGVVSPDSETRDDYAEIIKHKTSERRVLVAIGGDTPEQAKAFALSAMNPNGRERLIDSIYDFVEEYEFDGIVLHWQFPNGEEEIDNFFGLIEELNGKFQRHKMVTVAVSGQYSDIDSYTDEHFEILGNHAEYIFLMTYDLFQYSNVSTDLGIHAALADKCLAEEYGDDCDGGSWFHRQKNQKYVILRYINKIQRYMIVLGLPTYGRSYTSDGRFLEPGDLALGRGKEGEYTKEEGLLSYYEICERLNRPGNKQWESILEERQRTPYAYRDDQWVGYDDTDSILEKVDAATQFTLGGVFMWDVSLDDITGESCETKPFPLTRAVAEKLSMNIGPDPVPDSDSDSEETDPAEDSSDNSDGSDGVTDPYSDYQYEDEEPKTTTPGVERNQLWDLFIKGNKASVLAAPIFLVILCAVFHVVLLM